MSSSFKSGTCAASVGNSNGCHHVTQRPSPANTGKGGFQPKVGCCEGCMGQPSPLPSHLPLIPLTPSMLAPFCPSLDALTRVQSAHLLSAHAISPTTVLLARVILSGLNVHVIYTQNWECLGRYLPVMELGGAFWRPKHDSSTVFDIADSKSATLCRTGGRYPYHATRCSVRSQLFPSQPTCTEYECPDRQ